MQIQRVAVVGAGNMGSGIAQAFAQGGFPVTLNDVDAGAIERGLQRIRGPLEKRVAAGKMKQDAAEAILSNITAEPDLEKAVADADLVVEAVFEDLKVKQDLFRRLDPLCPERTVLATNTSSLYVKDLANATKRPDRVVGLHFFYPAAINRLLEVVAGPKTSEEAFRAAWDAGARAGKVPIRTADRPGFCVNRYFVPWLNEACRIVEEGVADIPTVEAAAREAFGITMGPFQLMNVTGVPIALHAQRTLHRELGGFYAPSALLEAQVEAGTEWDLSGDPDVSRTGAVASRLRGVAFGIACHLVEGDVASMRDTDMGATVGLRWRKGPFALMDDVGLPVALTEVQALHDAWGDAFPVPGDLETRAAEGRSWDVPAVRVAFHDHDRIAHVVLDRPDRRNALDATVLRHLDACLDAVVAKGTVRAVVLSGEGPAFAAGADIPTMKALDVEGAKAYTEQGNRVLGRLESLECPVVAAVHGACLGGGLELALCADLIYVAKDAKVGLPEVGLGIHPGFGGTQRLPRRIGVGAAKELLFTGRVVDGAEAARLGVANAALESAQVHAHAFDAARQIAAKAPLAVAGAKRSIHAGQGTDLPGGLRAEQESVVLLFATKDKDEGLAAFLERREPAFTGQ